MADVNLALGPDVTGSKVPPLPISAGQNFPSARSASHPNTNPHLHVEICISSCSCPGSNNGARGPSRKGRSPAHLAPCTLHLAPPSFLPPGKIKQATIKKSRFSLHASNKAPHNDFCMPSLAVLLASRLRATEHCRVPEKRQGGVENADER